MATVGSGRRNWVNQQEMNSSMRFGKYKHQRLCDLPSDYLTWLDGLDDLREPLRSAVAAECRRRASRSAQPPARTFPVPSELRGLAREILELVYRSASK